LELRDALSQIAEIRSKAAAAEQFRGYRAVPVGITGVIAVLVALAQSRIELTTANYLLLWLSTALAAAAICGVGIWLRYRQGLDPLANQLTWLAVGQFVPCLLAGGFVTLVVVQKVPEYFALLPGLWQVFFSLGVFASCRLLPKAVAVVGVWYLVAGCFNLTLVSGPNALNPWAMGIPFGIGQLATAAVLYWNLERSRDEA
jgi:hypothetical protein